MDQEQPDIYVAFAVILYVLRGGGMQAKLQNFTVSQHILTLISCSSETTKGRGVKVYMS